MKVQFSKCHIIWLIWIFAPKLAYIFLSKKLLLASLISLPKWKIFPSNTLILLCQRTHYKSRAQDSKLSILTTRGAAAAAESTGPSFLLWVSNGPVKTLEMCYSDVRTTANQYHASCATIAGSSSSSSCSLLHLESLLSRERKIDMRRTLVPRWTHMSNEFCACERFWGLKPQLVKWDSK